MKSTFLFLLLFPISIFTFAQSKDFLLLKRGTNVRSQIRFYPGEQITYKSTKLGYYVTDVIKEFSDDYVYLSENILSLNDIEAIAIRKKDRRNGTLTAFNSLILGAGVILLTVDGLNSVYHEGEFSIDKGVGITGGILVGTGIAMLPLRYKTFKNQGRNKLQIIRMRLPD
ncbi:hypothetical protein [Algoriphagus sp. PAP.12]|jgi:hypothetical protein|uniref:hypothetical protein n=1 Tax=Algoriphagus sp. PAP.12 TaxID=2996678 RepID=UPI00227C9FFA|nr:hypothetical protein [Algoriphagus sp. PAP.12]